MKTQFLLTAWLFAGAIRALAATYTLDDSASPIRVAFNDVGGKFTITHKATGWVWRNPDTLVSGTNPTSVTGATVLADGRTLQANITLSGNTYTLVAELRTSPSELRVTLGNAAANLSSVNYPHPFYASDGQGQAVLPFDSGYVAPNTATTFTLPGGMRGMEWYGGTDANNERGWMAIVDTPDDYELKVRNGTISGTNYLGAVMNWRGSNDNATHTANKLSYDRTVRFRFLESGGYVALAKTFRAEAQTRGWLKTLAQKQAETGAPNVDQFVGSPVIYLWGDGRSTAALEALKNAGVHKAHIQVSVNHVDQQKNFPATSLADQAWFDAVRARGYTGGFYDIYAAVRTTGQGGSPFDGFFYLWPGNAYNDWAIVDSTGAFDAQHTISAQMAASFAGGTRMPAHISRFDLDACFFDVVCAVDLREDYDATYGHFATRSMDRVNRASLLSSAYGNATKKLLTGTEQGRSWAVPVVHWTEGKFWIGNGSSGVSDGAWNDNSYPQIMTDVVEPTTTQLAALLSDGYQAPLWDLVFHDCLVTTVHWHRPHNKYVHLWDHQDRWALLRGQAPLLNLTYAGVQGLASRSPNTITDTGGNVWTSRLTSNAARVAQTYNTVCTWHQQIGKMEMLSHARLTADRSVQMTEFSNDNGASGQGIVVNFGLHDGATGIAGSTWTGLLRGQSVTVPLGGYQTYSWGGSVNTAPAISAIANQAVTMGAGVGPLSFTVEDAETLAGALTVTATSSNTTLLPAASIALGGTDASRTVTLTPASGQTGNSTVTLTVSDGLLTAQTSFVLTVSGSPQTVTSLAALHQNGQTYLTWNEVGDAATTYRIYRSASPFASPAQLTSGNLIGTASADSSFDARLSELRGTNYFHRITAAGPDLSSTQGLFVHMPTADGPAYYAVVAVIGGVEQSGLSAGQNTTSAVNETVGMPEPVYQRSFTISSRTVEVYVHWVSANATAFYPAMGNQNSVAHHLGLVRRGTASTHSLLIRPHARQGSFLSTVTGTSNADEWVLTLDDWMPNSIENTFWYGYHEAFDINTGLPQPTGGTVHDYTTRRAKWEIEWALRSLPIDPNRVYMAGHSMGGIGSFFLSMMMPEKIAAIWTTSAKFDFSFLHDPNPSNIWNEGSNERANSGDILWGTVAADLPCSEGLPVYDRLNAGYLAQAFQADNLPIFIAFNGKNDTVVGWAEKIGFYQAVAASRHGGIFFFDSGVHNRSGGEWVPEQDINVLNRYRLDQSYPAFASSTVSGNPGDGTAANGDAFGTIHGNLDWDTASIVDTASLWQIRLLTVSLSSTAGTIAAPASATVDVTPRRLQTFDHAAGRAARYEVRDAGSVLLKQGLVIANADGLYTVPAVPVSPAGTTLTLSTVFQSSPVVVGISEGFQLTWPTTIGVRYQVEWSPDLVQWFAIGTPTLASTSTMTWMDNGSQTGSPPLPAGRRFYRLRLSE